MTGRFAPSPTGRMHVGNAYAMLAAWLSARVRGDRMILRIEDIDGPRVRPDADRWIMDDLHWLGLDWDGDPIYQSHNTALYADALQVLSEAGMVYPCFCSRAEIRAASAPQEGDGYVIYPGTCRRLVENRPDAVATLLEAGERHSWRLAVPNDGDDLGHEAFDDRVYGWQHYDLGHDLGDSILVRADGLFAYQLAVTVDDLIEGVDDIVRGRDLLRSTALQMRIRDVLTARGFTERHVQEMAPFVNHDATAAPPEDNLAIGEWDMPLASAAHPAYAHLPLIDNAQGVRLAKRAYSLDLGQLRELGVSAEQVIGYCAALMGLPVEGATRDEDGKIDPRRDDFRPAPMSARDVLAVFSWDALRANRNDKALPDDLAQRFVEAKA